jgi:hypothetical protein
MEICESETSSGWFLSSLRLGLRILIIFNARHNRASFRGRNCIWNGAFINFPKYEGFIMKQSVWDLVLVSCFNLRWLCLIKSLNPWIASSSRPWYGICLTITPSRIAINCCNPGLAGTIDLPSQMVHTIRCTPVIYVYKITNPVLVQHFSVV